MAPCRVCEGFGYIIVAERLFPWRRLSIRGRRRRRRHLADVRFALVFLVAPCFRSCNFEGTLGSHSNALHGHCCRFPLSHTPEHSHRVERDAIFRITIVVVNIEAAVAPDGANRSREPAVTMKVPGFDSLTHYQGPVGLGRLRPALLLLLLLLWDLA